MRLYLIILIFIFVLFKNSYSNEYPNNYGMSKDWHIVINQNDYDKSDGTQTSKLKGDIQFWDSLNGIVTFVYSINSSLNLINHFYRTTDGGYTWNTSLSDTTFRSNPIGNVAVYGDKVVYCVLGKKLKPTGTDLDPKSRIYKSIDGGYKWEKTKLNFIDYATNIKIYDKDTIFACYKNHIVKSTNAGQTWVEITNEILELIPQEPYRFFNFQNLDITDDGTIYIFTQQSYGINNVVKSLDGGTTWDVFPTPEWSYRMEGIDKDTLIFNCRDIPDTCMTIIRSYNKCTMNDTLLELNYYPHLKGELFINGHNEIICDFGNPCIYTSDGGQTFDSLIQVEADNFEKGGPMIFGWSKEKRIFMLSRWYGDLLMYDPDFNENSVALEKIHNFGRLIYLRQF